MDDATADMEVDVDFLEVPHVVEGAPMAIALNPVQHDAAHMPGSGTPATTGMRQPKAKRPKTGLLQNLTKCFPKATWASPSVTLGNYYNLPREVLAMMPLSTPQVPVQDAYRGNACGADARGANVGPDAGMREPAQMPRRAHRAVPAANKLPNLPEGYEMGQTNIGKDETEIAGGPEDAPRIIRKPRFVSAVFKGVKNMVEDCLKKLPGNQEAFYLRHRLKAPEHLTAERYAREHGYIDDNGEPDMVALAHDAHARKLMPIDDVYTICVSYETKIEALERELDEARTKPQAGKAAPRRKRERVEPADEAPPAPPGAVPAAAAPVNLGGRPAKAEPTVHSQKKAGQRLRKDLYGLLEKMKRRISDSPRKLGQFIISAIKSASKIGRRRTGPRALNRYQQLPSDMIEMMFDDDELGRALYKEGDKRRRPPMARYVLTRFQGLTVKAMDLVRFATHYMPGHSTSSAATRDFEMQLSKRCPSGPKASKGTRMDEEQQRQAAAAAEEHENDNDDDDDDLEAEADQAVGEEAQREPTQEEAREASADEFTRQALKILHKEYPNHDEPKIWDQWAGGVGLTDAIWKGANSVHVIAHRGGIILGFIKVLLTSRELFLDELLVVEAGRRQGLATHLLDRAGRFSSRQSLIRLQVNTRIGAVTLYKDAWGMQWWKPRAKGSLYHGIEESADPGCAFMEGVRADVLKKVKVLAADKPLADDIQFFVMGAFAIKNMEFDFVGIPDEEWKEVEQQQEGKQLQEEQEQEPAEPQQEDETLPFDELSGDTVLGEEDAGCDHTIKPSHGVLSMADPVNMVLNGTQHGPDLLTLCTLTRRSRPDCTLPAALSSDELYLPDDFCEVADETGVRRTKLGDADTWCHATYPAFKGTADAASFQNAPKGQRKCTSAYLTHLGSGVRSESGWGKLVQHMAPKVHSCHDMFPICVWFGGDDGKHCKEHLEPRMTQTRELEQEGTCIDLPLELPPWDLLNGVLRKRPLDERPNVRQKKSSRAPLSIQGKQNRIRARLTKKVRITPRFMWAFDGATLNAIGGATHQSKKADVFSDELTEDMGSFHAIGKGRKGKTLRGLAEQMAPGCSDPSHRHHDLIEYLAQINRHSRNSELQSCTREPARRMEAEKAMGIGKHARRVAAVFANPANRDGRTLTELPYEDEDIVRLGYDHASFVPGINGDDLGAVDTVFDTDVLVRVPVMPKHFRDLPKAIWSRTAIMEEELGEELEEQEGLQDDERAPPRLWKYRFGLCIMHCAMRTAESCLKHMLLILQTRYKAGHNGDRRCIDTHLNEYLLSHLRIRMLITLNDKGELNKLQINGTEAKRLMEDVIKGEDSKLLQAVKRTYASLKYAPDESTTQVGRWAEVLRHWGLAMNAAFVMRAGEHEQRTFAKHARLYVMEKSCIRAGITTWYDWQMYSMMPRMFYTYGSLYAICQEGIEGCQKQSAMLVRLSSKFANVGRIPLAAIRAGRDAVLAYLKKRKQNVKTPEQFLFLRQLCTFYAHHYDRFERLEELARAGEDIDWETEFVPAWRSFVCISIIYRICAAKRSWDKSTPLEQSEVLSWTQSDDGRTFKVEVHDKHRHRLVSEIVAYYAPVALESSRGLAPMADLTEKGCKDRRTQIQKARKARWQAQTRDPELWRRLEYVPTH